MIDAKLKFNDFIIFDIDIDNLSDVQRHVISFISKNLWTIKSSTLK